MTSAGRRRDSIVDLRFLKSRWRLPDWCVTVAWYVLRHLSDDMTQMSMSGKNFGELAM